MSGKVWRAVYAPTSNSASRANKRPRQLSAALIRLNRPGDWSIPNGIYILSCLGSRITTAAVVNASAA